MNDVQDLSASSIGFQAMVLDRSDLMRFETRLVRGISAFLPHQAHSLHFPEDARSRAPEYVSAERRLFLPLYAPASSGTAGGGIAEEAGALLGVYAASGVRSADVRPVLRALPHLASLLMDNLLLHKRSLTDPVSGLYTQAHLLDCIAAETDALRGVFSRSPADAGISGRDGHDGAVPRRPSFALLVLRLHSLPAALRAHGYLFVERLLSAAGDAVRQALAPGALPARSGEYELAVLLPGVGIKACREAAAALAEALEAVRVRHELTRRSIGLAASIGFTLYPQDMAGFSFGRPAPEQARLLLRNARRAATLAEEAAGSSDRADRIYPAGSTPVLPFARILERGGTVTELLPLSRVRISLGADAGAREGLRFAVWDGATDASLLADADKTPFSVEYKGEISLLEVRGAFALAEIIQTGDPARPVAAGDRLTLLTDAFSAPPQSVSISGASGDAACPDPATGFLRYSDFLTRWSLEREHCDNFALGLVRLAPGARSFQPDTGTETGELSDRDFDRVLGDAARLCREEFGEHVSGGRYGLTSFIFFHPDTAPDMFPDALREQYERLCRRLSAELTPEQEGGVTVGIAAGIAPHPFLSFRKADALDNARKALEYGALLPSPHVGLLDSLALTISADKSFSLGDSFAAIEEYKKALLADEGNTLAWNSLGVCLAALGRHAEARRYFDRALALEPDGVMTLYNLGYSCQCLGEMGEARRHYQNCLKREPEHVAALLRLGQLAEAEGNVARAGKFFIRASRLPAGKTPALRQLAALALGRNDVQEARELLHEVLSADPQNAVALHMLAAVYLDGGDDALVAESLARQSIALRPGLRPAWLALARALETGGKSREAREALSRANEL